MQGYYQEIIDEIEKQLQQNQPEEAKALLDKELAMPYIPQDVEEKLHELKRDADYQLGEKRGRTQLSEDEVLDGLTGNAEMQMRSAEALTETNLRRLIPELQNYLLKDPYPEAAALLIEGIAEQEIGEEFVFHKEGIEYTFWGDDITPVTQSGGFLKAMVLLKEWLSDKHPDMYALAKTLLVHKVYMFLPLTYEEDEGEDLAFAVLEEISNMMDDGEIYREIKNRENSLSQIDAG